MLTEYRKSVSELLNKYLPTKLLRTLILPQSIKYQGPVLHCHSCAAQFRMCMCLLYTADFAAAFWAPGFGRTRVRPVTKASEIANSNCMRTFQHSHCLILLGQNAKRDLSIRFHLLSIRIYLHVFPSLASKFSAKWDAESI